MSDKVCSIEGCEKRAVSCDYCSGHYHRLNRYGSPTGFSKNGIRDGITKRYPREHDSYWAMRTRCLNKNHIHYGDYGGRGIGICDRWMDKTSGFRNFLEDMGPKPPRTTLDRINNNEDYSPSNCRWANWQEQQNNRRSNKTLTYMGETHTIAGWSRILGIKQSTIYARVKKGCSASEALSKCRLRKK